MLRNCYSRKLYFKKGVLVDDTHSSTVHEGQRRLFSLDEFFYTAFSTQFFAALFVKVLQFPSVDHCRETKRRIQFQNMWKECRSHWSSRRTHLDAVKRDAQGRTTNPPCDPWTSSKVSEQQFVDDYEVFKKAKAALLDKKPANDDDGDNERWLAEMHEVRQGISTIPPRVKAKVDAAEIVDVHDDSEDDATSSSSVERVSDSGDYDNHDGSSDSSNNETTLYFSRQNSGVSRPETKHSKRVSFDNQSVQKGL